MEDQEIETQKTSFNLPFGLRDQFTEGKLPSKNAILLEALKEWLDRVERKRR